MPKPRSPASPTHSPATPDPAPLPDAAYCIRQSAALYAQGQIREAMAVVMHGLSLDPDNTVLLNHRGVLAARLGDAATAEAAYRRAIALQPGDGHIHYNLGNLLKARQRLQEAEDLYRRALAIRPDYPEAWSNLGDLLREQQRFVDAEEAYRRAIAAGPDYAIAHSNLGNLLQEQRRADEAEAAYRRAIAANPRYAKAHSNLGVLLKSQQRYAEAEAAYLAAIAADPGDAPAYSNLSVLLLEQMRMDEAETACRKAIAAQPDYASGWTNFGCLLQAKRRVEEAEAVYHRALSLDPGEIDARWNLSLLLLRRGRYAEGWPQYESRYSVARKERKMAPPPVRPGGPPLPPQWRGESLAGKSVLIWAEQGLGDELQFVRYLPLVRAMGPRHITLACKPPLRSLFAAQSLADRIISTDWHPDMAGEFDCWSYLLSLPLHMGSTLNNLPAKLPYLTAPQERIARWSPRLPKTGQRVGLVWKGSATHRNDAHRSLPSLAALAPLWSVPGIRFVSLQKGAGEDQAAAPPAGQPLMHLGGELADFADSAAVLSQIDLLICVDTAMAHLAGALGKSCWVLLPDHDPDWRWMEDREDSPWYPGVMRLFRQKADGDWTSVVRRVAKDLKAWSVIQPR